jgi:tryptophan synthase alpha chain
MSAIDQLFAALRTQKRKALMPFITAGDPDLDFTRDLLVELAAQGASLCELGVPYSDPIADGPVIQASYTRALAKHIKLHDILSMLGKTTPQLSIPVVTMVSYAIIYRHGLAQYVADAQKSGVTGAIVPDLPVEEAAEFAAICRKSDFSLIQLVTPTTPRDRALRIAEQTTGFLYYVSVTGITGERTQLPSDLLENVAWLRGQTPLPICIGFGISTTEHVKLLAPVADGLIVGSAVVRRLADVETKGRAATVKDVGAYVRTLVAALDS